MKLPLSYDRIIVTVLLKGDVEVPDSNFRPTYEYIRNWIVSVRACGANGVIIHDGCIQDNRILNSGMHCIEMKDRTSKYPFVERWFLFEKLLLQNTHIVSAFFTDARDIFLHEDPNKFFVSSLSSDCIITQEEWTQFVDNAEYMKRLAFCNRRPDILDLTIPQYYTQGFYPLCAGFFGGNYVSLSKFFKAINERYIPECDSWEWDMAIFNYVLYKVFDSMPKVCIKSANKCLSGSNENTYTYINKEYGIKILMNGENVITPVHHGLTESIYYAKQLTGRTSDLSNQEFAEKFSNIFFERDYGVPKIIKDLNMLVGVEIGVESGIFSEKILNLGATYLLKLYSIDIWKEIPEKRAGNNSIADYTLDTMLNNMKQAANRLDKFNGRSCIIREQSCEAIHLFNDRTLDFVYIDADHSYEAVKRDIEMWIRKVSIGGVIMGHDYLNYESGEGKFGVKRAVDEIFKDEIIVTKNETNPTWAHLVHGQEVI